MPTPSEVREIAYERGLAKKRKNAIVALLSGALPGVVLSFYLLVSWERWLIGLVIGLIWGNAFEYAYHRWMLHRKKSSFARGHLQHHSTIGAPEEAEHVTLGRSPFHIALLFASNGVLVIVVDLLLGLGLTPGIFVGWTVYLIAAEEVHWRIHMEGWLPWGLGFARAYHMSHHDTPNTRYNVFLPFFDFLLGNSRLPEATIPLRFLKDESSVSGILWAILSWWCRERGFCVMLRGRARRSTRLKTETLLRWPSSRSPRTSPWRLRLCPQPDGIYPVLL